MGARFRSWWQQIKQHLVTILIVVIILVVAIALIIVGYRFNWTGFNGNNKSGKTLWDWMQLLLIPGVLAVAGFWFNHRERKAAELRAEADREISFDNQREAALKEYIDKMSELLLHEKLLKSEPEDEVRKIARALTLTVLPRCDGGRKKSVLQFLYESGLIERDKSIIRLNDANLSGASLNGAILNKADLGGANLSEVNLLCANLMQASLWHADLNKAILNKADLNKAILVEAILSGASLNGTNLMEAELVGANLSEAKLNGAFLNGANLWEAKLNETNLSEANLNGAKVAMEQLNGAKSLKGATMPDGSVHP